MAYIVFILYFRKKIIYFCKTYNICKFCIKNSNCLQTFLSLHKYAYGHTARNSFIFFGGVERTGRWAWSLFAGNSESNFTLHLFYGICCHTSVLCGRKVKNVGESGWLGGLWAVVRRQYVRCAFPLNSSLDSSCDKYLLLCLLMGGMLCFVLLPK